MLKSNLLRSILRRCLVAGSLTLLFCTASSAQTVPSSPPQDANGFTVFSPSVDTKTIYVSSSSGSDSNSGLSAATPVQTLAKGTSLLRKGYPDWLLLKKGDVWTGDVSSGGLFGNNGFTGWQGRSASEPMLISSYGVGARPLIQAWTSNTEGATIITSSPSSAAYFIDYVAVVGIEFYSFKSDPSNASYMSTGSSLGAITILNPANWILIEDCKFRFLGSNFQALAGSLFIRRNVIVDSFSIGLYVQGYSYFLLEENIFNNNGWNAAVAPRSIFNHNVYGQSTATVAETTVYRGNISANGSNTGLRSRQGGLIDNNLLIQNGYGIDYGQADGSSPNSPGTNAIQNNVILLGQDITGAGFIPVGISVSKVAQPVSVSNNVVAHADPAAASSVGITLSSVSQSVTASANVVADWGGGGSGFTIRDFGTGNTVAADNITSASSTLTGFLDPTRSVGSYAGTIGLISTLDAFLTAAAQQSKDNWNPALTANSVNNYIRAGFNKADIQTGTTTGTSTTTTSTTPTPTTATPSELPPSVVIVSPSNGLVLKGASALNISVSASDSSGISSISVKIDGSTYLTCQNKTTCSGSVSKKKISQGTHVITAEAVDKTGLSSQASASVTWLNR